MIRRMKAEDREYYIALSKEFYSSDAVLHRVNVQNFSNTLQEILAGSPYADGFILEQGGKAAGYAIIAITYSNEVGGMVIWLEEAYIAPEFRGCGLGSEFFQYMEEQYPKAKRFRLEVTRSNQRAIQLYKRMGFEEFDYLQMVKDRI